MVRVKKFVLAKCTELIQYECKSEVAVPRELTLAAFKPYFTALSGKLTHFAVRKIFNQLRLAAEEALKDPIGAERIAEVREWKSGDCECEDPYQFGLPCRHLLMRSYIKRFPIPLTLVHPRWCIATAILAESNWRPSYIKSQVLPTNLSEQPKALTRIQLSALRIIDLIEQHPEDEIALFADQFEAFEASQTAFLSKRAMLQALPEGAPFLVPPQARWQPPPLKQHGKANRRGQTSAETAERIADKAVRELRKDAQEEERRRSVQLMPPDPRADVNLGDNGVVDEEPPDDIDEDDEDYGNINDQDLTMAYDEVMGGGEEVSLLDISGEDEDTWRDDLGVLAGTRLDVFSEESSKEIEVASLEEPVKYQEPEPVLLY